MQNTDKVKTYFELLAEREHLDRELSQARAREAEAVLKEIAEKMWLFAFTPRDVEKAYRKHELLYSNPKVQPEWRIRQIGGGRTDAARNGGEGNEQ